jgi:hypothetical protein
MRREIDAHYSDKLEHVKCYRWAPCVEWASARLALETHDEWLDESLSPIDPKVVWGGFEYATDKPKFKEPLGIY